MSRLYLTEDGPVMTIGTPLVSKTVDVPRFNQERLVAALRSDQAGQSTFPGFLAASWRAGPSANEVDFTARIRKYYGSSGEE
jgi:uncharacterized protein YbcV (DUF1398 family)